MQNQISIVPNIKPIIIANQINPKIQQNYLYPLSSPQMLQENKMARRFQSPAPNINGTAYPRIKQVNTYTSYNSNKLLPTINYMNRTFTKMNQINNVQNNQRINGTIKPIDIKNGLITNKNLVASINTPIKNPNLNNGIIPQNNLINNINNVSIIQGKNINNISNNNVSLVPGNNLLNNINNKVNVQAPMNNIRAVPNINVITNTVKSIGYSNNIVTQPINLSGKGVNDVNNSISFIPKLGVSVNPPINQVGLIQPNIINNNMIASNNLREPYETINLAEFKLVREIGKGTFGRIYEVIWIINNKHYALKKEVLRNFDGVKVRQHRNEAIKAFIKNTKSNGVVSLYGNLTIPIGNEFQYYELMEMCERDFEQEIKSRSAINRIYTEIELSNVILQLVTTLSFLQKNHITHRDIKPQNILILNGIYKLCDFGDIRVMERDGIVVQRVRGSELYMSPILFFGLRANMIQVKHNTYKSDVFSLGMCIFLAACISYDGLVEIRELSDSNQKLFIINKYLSLRYSPRIIKIIHLMLQTEEIDRPDFILLESIIKQYGL